MTFVSDAALRHLQAVTDLPDLSGTRYEPRELLGRGGMGSVYLVADRQLERDVALKVLHDQTVVPDAARHLLREARILARLEHPGIVPVHDLGQLADGRTYYAMKYVRGERLDEYLARPRTLGDRLAVFERICEALAFAHAAGVVHRDLKPANIMLGAFGEVLVLDWGVAKSLGHADEIPSAAGQDGDTQTRRTAAGTVIGTPGFMSPEQARGQSARVDARSDVFGLGGVLYFLLTGDPPLAGAVFQRLRAGGSFQAPDPRRVAADVPRQVAAICRKCLADDPDERYVDVAALRADLGQFRGGFAVSALQETPLDTAARVLWKFRAFVLLLLAYIVMRALLLSWPA